MSGQDAARPFLDKIDTQEQALAAEAERTRDRIEELTARLREFDEEPDHLRITRKTLITLAREPDADARDGTLAPAAPEHPAYQQILTVFADAGRPLRARDRCEALDLPIQPKHTEGIRSKLKRLVDRGILTEPERGLFAQPRP